MDGPDPALHRGARFHVAALAVGVFLALAQTWPLATSITTHVPSLPGNQTAGPDQLLTSWILASDVRKLFHDPLGVFETNNMYPFRHTLAYSENLLGMAIVVWPLQVLWNDPILTNNIALLMTIALSGYGVMLLVHELTDSVGGAIVGAVFATYAPFVWINIDQLHVASGQSSALAIFALARVVRTRAWRHAVLLGTMAAWQAWATLHWGVFLALGLVATVLVLLLLSAQARRALPQLAGAGLLAAVLVAPLAVPYLAVAREMDLHERVIMFPFPWSAVPPFTEPVQYLLDRIASGTRSRAQLTLGPWYAMAAGLLAGVVLRRPRTISKAMMAAIAASVFVNYWYAAGPVPFFGIPSLFNAMSAVPGFGVVRAPARALGYSSLMAAVLGGCGVAVLLRPLRWRAAQVVVVAVFLAIAIIENGWQPVDLGRAPQRDDPLPAALAELPPDCPIAEVPDDFAGKAAALFRSTKHWRPVLTGYSGVLAVSMFVEAFHLYALPDSAALRYLHAAGACAVLIQRDTPVGARIAAQLQARGIPLVPVSQDLLLMRVPAPGVDPPDMPRLDRDGWRIVEPATAGNDVLDGSLETVHRFAVTLPPEPERLTVDLGRRAIVTGVDVALGYHFRYYLVSYKIDASRDGITWVTIGKEFPALPPFQSYRADWPQIVQRIRFPQAVARFIRIGPFRMPAGEPFAVDAGFIEWGVAELYVRGVPLPG
jgi:hypothetical protein